MEPNKPGNKDLPDFKELSDRVIADATEGPRLVIKTNLDKDNVKDDNPYISENKEVNTLLRDYFDE
jgi:hypothetical protein